MNILSNYIKSKLLKILSGFFEDAEQGELNLDFSAQELVLKNVYLKTSVINNFLIELPFEVVSGSIQTLILKIPWTSLFSSPFEVFVDYPIIDLALKDTSKESLFSKEKVLEKLYEMFKKHIKHLLKADEEEESWEFTRNLQQKIVDNLKVKVYNLFVNLACPTIITNPIFQLSMSEFDFYTTDDSYRIPAFFDRNLDIYRNVPISKLLRLNDLILTIGDNSHPVRKIEITENSIPLKSQRNENDVFKFSLEIYGKIKTNLETEDQEPKYFASINILTFKIMISERQIDHVMKLSDSINEFSKKLFYFYNFKLQNPQLKIRDKDLLGGDPVAQSVLIRRWWFYSISLVLKDQYVKKTENVWMQFLHKKRKVQTAKLPNFILIPFKEPIRRIVKELIDNEWKTEGVIRNPREVFDLETILLSLPEAQLKLLIKQSCGDIINWEKEKRKNKSFFLNILSKVGLYKPKPNISELRKIIEENIVEDAPEIYNYLLKLEVKFHSWRIHVKTDYNSIFMIEIKGFSLSFDQFLDTSKIIYSFKKFSFDMQGQDKKYEICFSQDIAANFIEGQVVKQNSIKNQRTDIQLKFMPLIIEIRKEIFDEIYLFMKARKSKKQDDIIYDKEIPITLINFENALRNITSDVYLYLDMSSAIFRVLLDEKEKTILTFYSGNLKANIGMINTEKRNEYSCSLENMQIAYTLHENNINLMDISIFGRSSSSGISTMALELISKRIVLNFWPRIINDMKNNVLSFLAKNVKKATEIPPVAIKQYKIAYFRCSGNHKDDKQYHQSSYEASTQSTITFYENKSLTIDEGANNILQAKIRDLKFTYFSRKKYYLLKVY
jgi:hypothetical protein